jgi:hypothetical protein
MPWQAPAIALVIAAIVSLSPPSEAAVRRALPGIAEMQREDRKRSRHRFLRHQADPDQLDDVAYRAVMISSIDQANRPRDSPGDGLHGHPLASLLADFSSANPERRSLADGRASNAAADGGATAAAPAIAIPVWCVTWDASTTRSTSASRS